MKRSCRQARYCICPQYTILTVGVNKEQHGIIPCPPTPLTSELKISNRFQ